MSSSPDPERAQVEDCGHACCDDRTDPLHSHFLTPTDCQQCARAKTTGSERARVEEAVEWWEGLGEVWPIWFQGTHDEADKLKALVEGARLFVERLAGSSPDYEAAARLDANHKGFNWTQLSPRIQTAYIEIIRRTVDAAFPNREGGSPQ